MLKRIGEIDLNDWSQFENSQPTTHNKNRI